MHHVGNAWNVLDYCLEYPCFSLFFLALRKRKQRGQVVLAEAIEFDHFFDTEKTEIKGIERTFSPLFLMF